MVTCLLKLEVWMLPLFLRVPVSSEEVSGHLSVEVRGMDVASLSTSACVK